MHIDLDILVYALIAALLLGRLWAVLGTRNDNEPQQPNPFPPPQPQPAPENASPQITSRMPAVPLPPASLAGGLAQVMAIDTAFEEKAFLQNVRDIFPVVVSAYAANKLTSVSEFLAPALLAHFQQAADARLAAGQIAQCRVASIKDAEVTSARAEAKQAFVTVKFLSLQESILRDTQGAIIAGEEGKLVQATDTWTFTRDTQVTGSKWVVIETRG